MAKRKAAKKAKSAVKKGAKKALKRAARKPVKKVAKPVKKAAKKKVAPKAAKAAKKRPAPVRKAAKKPVKPVKKAAARKAARKPAPKAVKAPARKAAPKAAKAKAKAPKLAAKRAALRKAPALNRVRRTIQDEDIVQSPPSSLDLDRRASAVRTGRREMKERYDLHTESSPALTGGDVDADWEGAYSTGDEAPGGDNPTPDQDIVDDIGKALGVVYEDNEELKGEKKISDRDDHRWELDPASAEDYNEHDED